MNSFNGPAWTLMFEYIGNILYAFIFRHLPRIALVFLLACCAVCTLDVTLGWNLFGLFPEGPHYTVIGGWSLDPQQIYIGFTRLLYPFLCGLLISRILPSHRSETNPSGSPIHLKGGFWWCSLALVVLFSIPCIGGKQPGLADGLYQACCILVLFPVIVLAGSGSVTTHMTSTKVCKFLGDISYPIYITHYPIMYMQMSWVKDHAEAPLWIHVCVNAGVVVMSVILAYGLLKAYDEPVREWLKDHWLKRRAQ
jgi:peptidoglycan/LPS O-acetylase OafA/YrhL